MRAQTPPTAPVAKTSGAKIDLASEPPNTPAMYIFATDFHLCKTSRGIPRVS